MCILLYLYFVIITKVPGDTQCTFLSIVINTQSLTPKMARLSLSSVALRDGIVHGLPVTGRELGMSTLLVQYLPVPS